MHDQTKWVNRASLRLACLIIDQRKSVVEEDTIDVRHQYPTFWPLADSQQNNTFFRVNFDKFNIHIRNQVLQLFKANDLYTKFPTS